MSGIIWPIEAQPVWLANYLSKLLPLTYATEAFRDILQKGWEKLVFESWFKFELNNCL